MTPGRPAAHQRRCIIVVIQSNHVPQLVSDNIACATGQRERIQLITLDCYEDFSVRWPTGGESTDIEEFGVGQSHDHIANHLPNAMRWSDWTSTAQNLCT